MNNMNLVETLFEYKASSNSQNANIQSLLSNIQKLNLEVVKGKAPQHFDGHE